MVLDVNVAKDMGYSYVTHFKKYDVFLCQESSSYEYVQAYIF